MNGIVNYVFSIIPVLTHNTYVYRNGWKEKPSRKFLKILFWNSLNFIVPLKLSFVTECIMDEMKF